MRERQSQDYWKNFAPETTPATTPIEDKFWNYFSPGDKILEVGTAWGRIIRECLKRNLRVSGIDINEKEISNLQEKLRQEGVSDKVILFVESATVMHFPDNSFDGIFLQGLLSALPVEERSVALQETRRVLKPGGYIHIAEFELNNSDSKVIRRYQRDMEVTGEYGTIFVRNDRGEELFKSHNFSESELESLTISANLESVSINKKMFPTFKGKLKPGIIFIARKKQHGRRNNKLKSSFSNC